jgi:hypothetical protein
MSNIVSRDLRGREAAANEVQAEEVHEPPDELLVVAAAFGRVPLVIVLGGGDAPRT